jgi:short-subunit dehydrogenase
VGLEAMAAGKSYVISGFMNNVMKESQRLAPRSLVSRMAANMMRPDKS